MMDIELFSASDRPELVAAAEALGASLWPNYLSTESSRTFWGKLYEEPLARFQTIAVDKTAGHVVALGNSIPFVWPASGELPHEGWDWVLAAGATATIKHQRCDSLSALSVAIAPDWRGKGIATTMLTAMKTTARAQGLTAMVAPVRPTHKHLYPLHDFATYCGWQNSDGSPFDPWFRTHVKMGARFLQPALRSMTVTATPQQWTSWTGLRFPASGSYWLPSGLNSLWIELETKTGTYEEPNFWMRHPL
jgi:GNAT superfamily N-acetyltransferase